MCMVSNIGDDYMGKFKPWIQPVQPWHGVIPMTPGDSGVIPLTPGDPTPNPWSVLKPVTREEFDDLKKLVEQMRKDLAATIEYDKATNQPDCQNEEKYKILRAVAEALGLSLEDIIPRPK